MKNSVKKNAKKAETQNIFFGEIKAGLEEALKWSHGKKGGVTMREVEIADPPRPMTPRQIAALRKTQIGASQAVFASLINASVQTVHAWEQGRGRPSGPALRLLRLLEKRPELARQFGEP